MAKTKTYLVEVAPLTKSPLQGTLSYFSGVKLAPGALIKVTLRNKLVTALVLSAKDVRSSKQDIRRANFQLKKIRKSDILDATISESMIEALLETARYYVTPIGTLLASLLPKLVLSELEIFLKPPEAKKRKPLESAKRETILFQMESEERFGQYRALVRQSFARGNSVVFVVPTHFDAKRVKEELSKGITEFVHLFTLSEKLALARAAWEAARAEKHPVLFITTPAGISFSRPDIGTIIIERASSRAYRTLARPYIDLKRFIALLAKHGEMQLVLGDAVLPIETLWREKNGEYGEMSLVRWRLPAAPAKIVDASTKQNEAGRFEIFSRELRELISKALEEKSGRIFLFGARKGLAPTTVCGDCGTILPCTNCGAPVVLHKREDVNIYVCHSCGSVRESLTVCGNCKSWKLVPLGIGTEEIARQTRALFPGVPVIILDKDHAPTDKKARTIAKQFVLEGGILVGTELAFFHLDPVPYSGLVSVDALFSVPDFHINERIFYLVSRLRELTRTEVIIQTRNIGRQLLAWAAQGNIIDFYQNEIAEREALLYPPFSVFITIEASDKMRVEGLRERFAKWNPDIFRHSIVMRVPRNTWPEKELATELSLLGPEFSIKVDPESIL